MHVRPQDLHYTQLADAMARGRAKLTKCQRSCLAQKDTCRFPPGEAQKSDKLPIKASTESDTMATVCFHSNVKAKEMARISELISELFLLAYKMSVPYMFQGMAQSIEMEVIRQLMLDFFAKENYSKSLKTFCKCRKVREKIKRALEAACNTALCEMILHLSTEDGFDMICDHANRHGHDTDMRGPPCACSLASCIDCLEMLVENAEEPAHGVTQPTKRPIDKAEIAKVVRKVDSMEVKAGTSANPWIDTIADVYDGIADTFWDAVIATDVMKIDCVRQMCDKLAGISGITLWYAVAAREMESSSLHIRCKGKATYSERNSPDKKWQFDEFVKDSTEGGEDIFGDNGRKMLAEVAKKRGNKAFTKFQYEEAVQYYTHAIAYSAYEPVFSLNRAASYLKLDEFSKAESDCSNAIMLDVSNHKAWFRRGISRAQQDKIKQATEDFERALQLRADDAEAYEELAKLSLEHLANAYKRMGITGEPPPMPSRKDMQLHRTIAKKPSPAASQSSQNLRIASRRSATSQALRSAPPVAAPSKPPPPPPPSLLPLEAKPSHHNLPPAALQRLKAVQAAKALHGDPGLQPSNGTTKKRKIPTGRGSLPSPLSQNTTAESSAGVDVCVEEVISQVSFAIAFSYVLHQKTGVNVQVPLPCWHTPKTHT